MTTESWECPFCFRPQIVSENNLHRSYNRIYAGKNVLGPVGLGWTAISCLNEACRELTLIVELHKYGTDPKGNSESRGLIQRYTLRPESNARHFPDCVPESLRQDYIEACKIKNLSPKASATLARRCLQGIIRDFCGISRSRLIDEIKVLEVALADGQAPRGVTHESIEAIDHVRKIGNIGAHMEKDINLIVDIDEGEAQVLIELIEMLFNDWYIEREKRNQRLQRIKEISEAKDQQKRAALPLPDTKALPLPDTEDGE